MNRREWLLARQQSIGSSDAPNLVGVGFRDAASVYRDKTEPVDDRMPTDGYLARGVALEPMVAARYVREMGVEIVSPIYNAVPGNEYSITYHPDRPWQSASLDRRRADTGATISLKTCAGWSDEWGEPGSADVPEGYRVQSQHEMGVTRTTVLDLAALNVIDWTFRVYRLDFDADYFEWLSSVELRFMAEHVLPKIAPTDAWEKSVNPPKPLVVRPGTIELPEVAIRMLEQRRELGHIRDKADSEYRVVTKQIEELMGDAEKAVAGPFKLRRSIVKGAPVSYNRADYVKLTISGGKGE